MDQLGLKSDVVPLLGLYPRGGPSAKIDIETGVLGKASQLPDGSHPVWFERHPELHAVLANPKSETKRYDLPSQ